MEMMKDYFSLFFVIVLAAGVAGIFLLEICGVFPPKPAAVLLLSWIVSALFYLAMALIWGFIDSFKPKKFPTP